MGDDDNAAVSAVTASARVVAVERGTTTAATAAIKTAVAA
jgi:hypothetical protein